MSGFSSLNTAVTGLNAQQRALSTIAQNIANANTVGYSRQRVDMSAVGGPATATFHTGRNALFGGVSVDAVVRIRDAFLEGTRAAAGARKSSLDAQVSTLQSAEQLLGEPSATGLQNSLDSFYSAWQDLAQRPTDSASGAVVIERGKAVAEQLHGISTGLADTWQTAYDSLNVVVSQTNQAASDLAALNVRIREATEAGTSVNDLLDMRDGLVRTIAGLVGGTAVPGDSNMVSVSVNGVTLVAGAKAEAFSVTGAVQIGTAATDPPTITWGTTAVSVESGRAAGLLAVTGSDLPQMKAGVDAVAVALRDAVNTVHTAGFTLGGTAGTAFFTGTDAGTLQVAVTAPAQLAVSKTAGAVDGSNALAIGDLIDDDTAASVLGGTGASEQWRNLTTSLGVRLQSLESAQSVQESVLATADAAVEADAGVSIDEEMTNMLMYQRAYEAAARVITTVDQTLDTLINRTGIVGR